jgi:periplasmic protein TonB
MIGEGCGSPLDDVSPKSRGVRGWALAGASLGHALAGVFLATMGHGVVAQAKAPLVSEWVEVDMSPPPPAPSVPPPPSTAEVLRPPPRAATSAAPPVSVDSKVPPSLHPAETPPAAAEAGQVLTAADEVVDFGDTVVSGQGSYAGGTTERGGTSKFAVRDGGARAHGVPGGRASAGPPAPSRARQPALAGGARWDCPFPHEADDEGVDTATVALRVQVGLLGQVLGVEVVSDPGAGFGREARRCALKKRWQPGLDREGAAAAMSALVHVRFER